jgi:hypothetical protein
MFAMKGSLLSRLRINGASYLISALILLLGIPLYQTLVLSPRGYAEALNSLGSGHIAAYLQWVGSYPLQFITYRLLLILAFVLLLSFPFSLFRIVVIQELMAQIEREEEWQAGQEAQEHEDTGGQEADESGESDGLPPYAWRGKGFAVIAAWAGLFGLIVYIVGAIAGTIYFVIVSHGFTARMPLPGDVAVLSNVFTLATNAAGIGLLALATLFFGAMIARSGRNLWPTIWVFFGYMALAVAALLSGSAVSVASAPAAGQAALTTPSIFLFALWMLWFGFMLVRLKPEI